MDHVMTSMIEGNNDLTIASLRKVLTLWGFLLFGVLEKRNQWVCPCVFKVPALVVEVYLGQMVSRLSAGNHSFNRRILRAKTLWMYLWVSI